MMPLQFVPRIASELAMGTPLAVLLTVRQESLSRA